MNIKNKRETKSLEKKVITTLKKIYDPELPVSIYDLGLIYKIEAKEKLSEVYIEMTLTTPNCPFAESLQKEVEDRVRKESGVKSVKVTLTFDPPYNMNLLTDEAKLTLGLL